MNTQQILILALTVGAAMASASLSAEEVHKPFTPDETTIDMTVPNAV